MRVLIVDDARDMRVIVADVCKRSIPAVETIEAEDGIDGLEKFEAYKPDLVITDNIMPRLCGDEMTEAMKGKSPDTPVVMFSNVNPRLIRGREHYEIVIQKDIPSLKAWLGQWYGQRVAI